MYVVDDDERLVGVCSLRQLVISRPGQPIRDVMEREVVSVTAETDQEEVADIVGRYDMVALPVTDPQHRLLGIVDVDDVVDVIREEATEDILKMAGAGEELAETRSFYSSLRVRWRWLMAAAIGGTVAALSLSGFDQALAKIPALAFFMPVVAGMGGNVGMQSSTIVVRGLAVGFVEAHRVQRIVVRRGLARRGARPDLWPSDRQLVVPDGRRRRPDAPGVRRDDGHHRLDDDRRVRRHVHAAGARSLRGRSRGGHGSVRHHVGRRDRAAVLLLARELVARRGPMSPAAAGTPAVVLATRPLGEADLLVVLLTPHDGKVRAAARHARKSKRRFAGGLTGGAVGQAGLVRRSSGLWRLDSFVPVTDHAAVGRDLTRFAYVAYLCELTDVLVVEPEPDPRLFVALTTALSRTVADTPDPAVLRWFELRLLAGLGLLPALQQCAVCGEPALTEVALARDAVRFDDRRGGVLCSVHGAGAAVPGSGPDHPASGAPGLRPAGWRSARAVQLAAEIVTLDEPPRWAGEAGAGAGAGSGPGPVVRRELRDLLRAVLAPHLRRPLRALEFFAQLPKIRVESEP